ncbi:putative DUF21 domain-containing protein [Hibiscus syriacus]|uniref:DUF21 domain-containing protein n=1 Tax=Hibiscus syriacus TaxID=106335 RepID=A0A6A2XIX4_HIBSY|nr:putative DUF21 domain-containing protein [Hibiscus syriacus]
MGTDQNLILVKRGILVALVCGVLVFGFKRVFSVEGVVNAGYGVIGQCILLLRNAWPKASMILKVFKEQGVVLTALFEFVCLLLNGGDCYNYIVALEVTEDSSLCCCRRLKFLLQVRELAEKDSEDGVFKMLSSDVTRFLTTILIGTTVVNIGATALVTDAATAMFGEAGVSTETGVMTVDILLLTKITPKSMAVHNPTEVARFVRLLQCEPYVTEDELKLMLRGAELSGEIEEEQDMTENVLEIKDTHVREVMTPLVDVVAIDASSTLVEFHNLWVIHQYSRVPAFEQRIDNIVGIAYALDLLDYVPKGELLESTTVGDMAHKPAYFVPVGVCGLPNLFRVFAKDAVFMFYIVTLEDVVEEIVGEIFDENYSKEEIQKKTGYIVMRAEGIFDVDANTSIDQLSEDLNIKIPEEHQYETVSGFVCEAFGYIPRTGESVKVVLERGNEEDDDENSEAASDRQDLKERHQIYKLEILAGNARNVSAVRFEQINNEEELLDPTALTPMVPKIVKKKQSSDEDSNNGDRDEDTFEKEQQDDIWDDHYVIADHKEDNESPNGQ